jgi:hypothetical protein
LRAQLFFGEVKTNYFVLRVTNNEYSVIFCFIFTLHCVTEIIYVPSYILYTCPHTTSWCQTTWYYSAHLHTHTSNHADTQTRTRTRTRTRAYTHTHTTRIFDTQVRCVLSLDRALIEP